MRHLLPAHKKEWTILLVLALVGAVVVWRSSVHDLGLSLTSIPIFICAAIMGLRRHWQRQERRRAAQQRQPQPVDVSQA